MIIDAAMDLFIGITPLAVFIEHLVWCHSLLLDLDRVAAALSSWPGM